MNIGKIVLATTVFGFVASSAFAMEKLNKITDKDSFTNVFLKRGSCFHYIDSVNPLYPCKKYLFFWTRWKLEKALTENNFVFCNLPHRRKAIICGTKDKKSCNDLKDTFAIKQLIASMSYNDPEAYDRHGYDCDGYDRDGNSRGGY